MSTLKWYIPIEIHYVHFGNLKDFPIRLIITPSSHFEAGGSDIDIVLNKEDIVKQQQQQQQQHNNDSHNIGRNSEYFLIKTHLIVKFNSIVSLQHHESSSSAATSAEAVDYYPHIISNKASITVNVACTMHNSYGRGCWRNGGTCHVGLLELLCNNHLSATIPNKKRMSTNNKTFFTSRKIYNSGYNVDVDDKLTGVISIAIKGDEKITKSYIEQICGGGSSSSADGAGKNSSKHYLWKPLMYCDIDNTMLLNDKKSKSNITSYLFRKKEIEREKEEEEEEKNKSKKMKQQSIKSLSIDNLIKLLFGLNLIDDTSSELFYRNISFSNSLENYLRSSNNINNNNSNNNKCHQLLMKQVENEWANYKRMVDNIFNDLVEIDVKSTKRMKCPWTPMDTTIYECYSDYSDNYIIHQKNLKNTIYPQITDSDSEVLRLSRKALGHQTPPLINSKNNNNNNSKPSFRSISLNTHYINNNVWVMERNTNTEGEYNQHVITAVANKRKNQNTQNYEYLQGLTKLDSEKLQKRFYLPFFAYIIHQPLVVYENYWGLTLNIMIERFYNNNMSYSEFELKFFDERQTLPAERASLAFQLICTYSQALEYISDYYMTKKGKSRKNSSSSFLDFFNTSNNNDYIDNDNEAEDPQKKEIEQFWNSLRSMCGDCDDLSFGILQFYYNFVANKKGKSFAYIQNNRILREMRRILEKNYIIFFQIEGVYLQKQTAGNELNSSNKSMYTNLNFEDKDLLNKYHHKDLPVKLQTLIDKYYPDVENMNSAHAAIKLLPKLYFERCVNRSYQVMNNIPEHMDSGPFYNNDELHCNSKSKSICKYHLNKPDAYNDDLPVLFGEGTSMLCCSDSKIWVKDTCKNHKCKEDILSDDIINDIVKVPIYSKKGESDFYKASLFGACLDFMNTENVTTFTYCRNNPEYNNNRKKNKNKTKCTKPFLRGVSHKQLSFKSENVILLPYGHASPNKNKQQQQQQQPEILNELDKHPCNRIRFAYPEMSLFMNTLCKSECKKRIRPRKLKKPLSALPLSIEEEQQKYLDAHGNKMYNMLLCDTKKDLNHNYNLVHGWCINMTNKYYQEHQQKSLSIREENSDYYDNTYNFFSIYIDNFYISESFLKYLKDSMHRKIYKTHQFKTSFYLERHSHDMVIWRIVFSHLKTIR